MLLLLVTPILSAGNDGEQVNPYIFLTFDDGPINATLDVLDVLKNKGVHATFFVNGNHLLAEGGEREDKAEQALRRIVSEGHVLGNHGYDHMRHNEEPYDPARPYLASYRDGDIDYGYFMPLNNLVVKHALGNLWFNPNNHMQTIGRLPYTNNWRTSTLSIDCTCCTIDRPEDLSEKGACAMPGQGQSASAHAGALLSDRLYLMGMQIFGWDVHWQPTDWSGTHPSETVPSVQDIVRLIDTAIAGTDCSTFGSSPEINCQNPPHQGKVVLLVHDFLFENSFRGRGADINLPKLKELITTLKRRGYVFKSLDQY